MAKRPQIGVNLPPDVHKWVRGEELRSGLSKTMLALAAFASLRILNDPERGEIIRWAKLIDEGQITWAAFEKAAEESNKERSKALERLLKTVLERADEANQKRSARPA